MTARRAPRRITSGGGAPSDEQQMMHGPLTVAQAEHVRQMASPVAERVFRIVETWPPLTDEQLATLSILLRT